MATIVENDDFDAESAAQKLKDAMQGCGTDEDAIIEVLVSHSCAQRQEIAEFYKTAYGQDLVEDLKGELSGDLEQVVEAVMTPPRLYDVRELKKAMKGAGSDEEAMIEILVSRSNEEIEEIKELYKSEFENELEEDIKNDTDGNFERFLVSLSNGSRAEGYDVDDDMANEDAQRVFDAGEGQCGTDESEFNKALCTRSRYQLLAMFDAYAATSGKHIEEVIADETTGTLEDGYVAIVKFTRSPAQFFADRIHSAISGGGTNDDTLIRIIASRSEVDLADIANAYKVTHDNTLTEAIDGDCGGDYKKMLMGLVRGQ